jgi:adenine-specific DNA methylase
LSVNITYMGTKRALTPIVSDVVRSAQSGIMLDVFSGMCSIGESVGEDRQIWSNDIQIFAAEVAKALFTSQDLPLSAISSGDVHFDRFENQRKRLSSSFCRSLKIEEELLAANSFSNFIESCINLTAQSHAKQKNANYARRIFSRQFILELISELNRQSMSMQSLRRSKAHARAMKLAEMN